MWEKLDLFARIAEQGSFQSAARDAEMSAVTMARRIDQLETELGLVLFVRGKAGVTLTDQGRELLRMVAPLSTRVTETIRQAQRLGEDLTRQRVRINATEPVIAEIIAPQVASAPQDAATRLELRVDNGPVDLSLNEAEIALRFLRPKGDSLRVKRLATFRMSVWRHKDQFNAPQAMRFVGYDDTYGEIPERAWMTASGASENMPIQTSSTRAILRIVEAGAAVGILPDVIAARHPDLRRVHGLRPVPARPIWLMMHPDIARQGHVRRIVDWLTAIFKTAG